MTLRSRWAFSILAILLLFGLNLAVYSWGNARRTEFILDLKNALESKDLVVEIRNLVASRHRDVEVIEPLLATGSIALEDDHLAEIRLRILEITSRIDRLQRLDGSAQIAGLADDFSGLEQAWLDIYETSTPGEGDAALAPASDHAVRFDRIDEFLAQLQAAKTAGAEQAEQDFSAAADLADRVTVVIFALSSLLTLAIAVWFSRFLRATFARYVTTEVVDNVLATRSGLELGGEKREVTVLMADLRGFSQLSERLGPEDVMAVINGFLGVMTEVIVDRGGTIDEFIGDAILVLFGAPLERPDHARAAVDCALRMQLAMREVNDRNRADGLPAVEMGIGIHSGEVVVGNIGSKKRTKYGAVGPSVNLAARIEANTVGGQILISESTFSQVDSRLRVDDRLEIQPKGFGESVVLYDVGGMTTDEVELALPAPGESIVRLARGVPVRFVVIEGSVTGTRALDGELLGLSSRAALVGATAQIESRANVRIELEPGSGAGAPRYVFAKVLSREPGHKTFVARFTSVDPRAAALLEELRSGSLPID